MTRLRWKNFLLPGLYLVGIFSISLLPRTKVQAVHEVLPLPSDKVLHLAVYTGFGFVLGSLPYPAVVLGTVGSLLGALDEQVQRLAPGRDVSLADWLADILGVSLGLALRRRFRP